ncbi:MAG: hypothetical protein ABIO70_08050 [Pseudomonadota bacterium]
MGVFDEWPEFMPTISLVLTVSSDVLTLGTSAVENVGDYDWSPIQLRGTILKNGSKVANLSIDSGTGAITLASGIAVSNGDVIEARFHFVGTISDPFLGRMIGERSCFMTVAGDGSTTFDDTYNVMPVPSWNLAFGWDGTNKLEVGVMVLDDDGASEDMQLSTRLLGMPQSKESGVSIDLSNTSTAQTHTADFSDADLEVACEMSFALSTGNSNPRVKDTIRLILFEAAEIGSYPAGFPSSGTMLEVSKPTGTWSAEVAEPA